MTVPWRLGGRPPKLDDAARRTLLAWAALGTSVPKVARRLGISPSTARRYLHGQHKRRFA